MIDLVIAVGIVGLTWTALAVLGVMFFVGAGTQVRRRRSAFGKRWKI